MIRPSLTHSSWKSLFLYLCFNEITFGPLRSQEVSLNFSPTRKGADVALYCSPKSLYHLAQLVGCPRAISVLDEKS